MAKMVHYSGRVQGVGFRATLAAMARRYPVSGWVRNLPDGRVQLLVDGPAVAVEAFLAAVRERWSSYVEAEQIEDREPGERLQGFTVR
jgi:acylphosphatase